MTAWLTYRSRWERVFSPSARSGQPGVRGDTPRKATGKMRPNTALLLAGEAIVCGGFAAALLESPAAERLRRCTVPQGKV